VATFGELLARFKQAETPESIFPLLNDVPLCNALVAWKSVKLSFKPPAECPSEDEQAQWEWLWNQVDYGVSSFGVVAGCKAQEAVNLIARLRGLQLIYPDGTINSFAKQYLGQLIIQRIQGKRKPAPTISSTK
jgi:hypothetical protein